MLVAPFLALLLLAMSNNRRLMGPLHNSWWQNVFGVIGSASVLGLSALLVYELARLTTTAPRRQPGCRMAIGCRCTDWPATNCPVTAARPR